MNIYNDGIASSQFQNRLLFCNTFKYLFLVPKGFAKIIGYLTKIFISKCANYLIQFLIRMAGLHVARGIERYLLHVFFSILVFIIQLRKKN